MADSFKHIKAEMSGLTAALTELAPDVNFGNISLTELVTADAEMDTKDRSVEQNEAMLAASQDDRKTFYQQMAKKLELVKNGVIGNPDFSPDSPLYGAMGLTRKKNGETK